MSAREQRPHAELDAFEQALAGLSPTATSVDRDELMYRAGRAAAVVERSSIAPARRWLWPTGSALAAVAAGLVGLWIGLQSAGREARPLAGDGEGNGAADVAAAGNPVAGHVAARAAIAAQVPNLQRLLVPPADAQDTYLNVRNHILARGVDAWRSSSSRGPAGAPPAEPRPAHRDAWRDELPEIRPAAPRDPAASAFNLPGANT